MGERVAVMVTEFLEYNDTHKDTTVNGGPEDNPHYYFVEGDHTHDLAEGNLVVLESTGVPVRGWSKPDEHNNPGYHKIVTPEDYDAET